ncbi:uncharacterized protein LOC132174162 [Corylus avellana]|uniref:uncharacterized protein LOC132174162 n=1 Tax=Corylus avellana TaxID=13451 RepID=UPI00286CCA69|nr:uncharacterized protein LOC132174162 [Corylus avellana]
MGFDNHWVHLVMQCVRTVSYSIIVNGSPVGNFHPSRGIRQGDPISPYLFLLCAEVLSHQLHQAEDSGLLKGVPTSFKGMQINHLFFADDSLLFCKATEHEWSILSEILWRYEQASGQRLNNDKTSIFFSRNTTIETRSHIVNIVGVPTAQRFDTYLGLPTLVGRSRIREFQGLIDRVRRKVFDRKTKFLSLAGKEVLLKAIVQAIPTYSMSIFLLPKELCKETNKMMQKFWWGHKENENKVHWMSWERLGRAKSQGGMGFRDLICFNKALLVKQCWRLLKDPDSLAAKIIRAKYYPWGDLLSATVGSRPSYAWRSIISGRDLLKEGLIWRIGNGQSVAIWGDKWIPQPSTYVIQTHCRNLSPDAKVEELIDANPVRWKKDLIQGMYNQPDRLIWRASPTGMFTVRSAYHLEDERFDAAKVEQIMKRLSWEELESFVMTANRIWKRRNEVIHGGSFSHPTSVVNEANELLQSFHRANVSVQHEDIPIQQTMKWQNPPSEVYKVNWDVAILVPSN